MHSAPVQVMFVGWLSWKAIVNLSYPWKQESFFQTQDWNPETIWSQKARKDATNGTGDLQRLTVPNDALVFQYHQWTPRCLAVPIAKLHEVHQAFTPTEVNKELLLILAWLSESSMNLFFFQCPQNSVPHKSHDFKKNVFCACLSYFHIVLHCHKNMQSAPQHGKFVCIPTSWGSLYRNSKTTPCLLQNRTVLFQVRKSPSCR